MPDENTQPSPPSPSSPSSLSSSRSLLGSLPGSAAAVVAIVVIGRPLGQALPGLIRTAAEHPREWGGWLAVAADLLGLGLLVAPVPTLDLARSLLGRVLARKE